MLEVQQEHDMRIQMNLTLVSIQACHVLNIKYFYNVNMCKYIKPVLRAVSLPLLTVMRLECHWWLLALRSCTAGGVSTADCGMNLL